MLMFRFLWGMLCLIISMRLGVMNSGKNDVCGVALSLYPHRANKKIRLTTAGIEPTTCGMLSAQCSPN